jgi:hypothetical protein
LLWLQTWVSASLFTGSSSQLHLKRSPLCWSCQSQIKSTPFHLEGCTQEIHSNYNLFWKGRISCIECNLDTTGEILPLLHPFWEKNIP